MDLPSLDLMLRGAILAVALAAAVAILARRRPGWPSSLAAFAVAGIAAFVLGSTPRGLAVFGATLFAFDAWCIATPAIVWLLAGTLFRDGFRPGPWHLVVAGVMVIVTFVGDWGRYRLGPLGEQPEIAGGMFLVGRAMALLLLATACAYAVAHWRADLVETRRRARAAFVGMISAVFVTLALSDFVLGPAGAGPGWLALGHVALLLIAFVVLQIVVRGGLDELLAVASDVAAVPHLAVVGSDGGPGVPAQPAVAALRSDGAEIALARRVTAAMESHKLWKREGLGIADLAQELGTQEYLLRRAINRRLGYRNFNDFLHDYRLGEAAQRLADPAEHHLPVLTIALDCGYGSIGPFNRAFKLRFGLTPSQFRQIGGKGIAGSEIGRISR